MGTFHFEPSARLQQFLGRELIGDPNLAIVEFVKNGFDAGATDVYVDFEVAGLAREDQTIRISDNGVGMDLGEFEKNWMHPGFSYKVRIDVKRRQNTTPKRNTAAARRDARIPIGEKGIGRLAAGRLGERLHVFTRKRSSEPWLHVYFDWREFRDMDMALNKVPIPYDFEAEPEEPRIATGTIIAIEDLTLNWAGRVPGRRTAGRSDSRVGRLRQDFEVLVLPLEPLNQEFRLYVGSNLGEHRPYLGLVGPADMQLMEYRFDFEISESSTGITVKRRIRRSPDIAEKVERPVETKETIRVKAGESATDDPSSHSGLLRSGPFRGTFYYAPWSGSAKRLQDLHIQTGVFVYRDGVRVEPYGGPDGDWLGAKARKASRQGWASIQPNQLYGFVAISKVTNRDLVDMSNRLGLLESEALDDFLSHARAEFRWFEEAILDEFVRPSWEEDADRARRVAERTQSYSDVIVRDLVHSLRQPIAGLGAEMGSLKYVLDEFEIPDGVREQLEGVERRSTEHLRELDVLVREFLEIGPDSDIEPVSLTEVVDEAAESMRTLAETHAIRVEVSIKDRTVLVRKHYLRRALTELLRNAIQAPRTSGGEEEAWVRVTSEVENGNVLIRVSDNGSGVDERVASELFRKPVSTKGRQGAGLISVRDLLATFKGRVELTSRGEGGAVFTIRIPSAGEVRKELRA